MHINKFVFGAGGHAKVVLDTLSVLDENVRLFDGDKTKNGLPLMGVCIEFVDNYSALPNHGHLAIGDNKARHILWEKLTMHIESFFSIVHPMASVSSASIIHDGCFIASQAVVGPETKIGSSSIINHGAVVDHDCKIGAFTHIAPNATLGGAVSIGDGSLIGSGAVILPGIRIGSNCVVGSGAVVTKDINDNTTVKGIPAVKR